MNTQILHCKLKKSSTTFSVYDIAEKLTAADLSEIINNTYPVTVIIQAGDSFTVNYSMYSEWSSDGASLNIGITFMAEQRFSVIQMRVASGKILSQLGFDDLEPDTYYCVLPVNPK